MAPTLTSNSFLVAVAPHSSQLALNRRRLTVITKKPATFAKAAAEDGESGGKSSPFSFDFIKLGDVKSLVPAVANPSSSGLNFGRRKDPATVFVAGATGQAGIRIAQMLLRQGFSVRAGVPDLAAAQELAVLAAKYKIISNEESKKLNAVNSTFEDVESIAKAIGNASKVAVTVGPAENGPSAEVTFSDALRVIQAAQLANVGHIAIVYDGTSGVSSSYNVLDGLTSFFSNFFSRSQPLTEPEFLQQVVETDLGYTLIRTRLTDDFSPENSYNVVVSTEGSSAGADYKVTKSQIASLVADVFSNVAVAENKVLQVFTDPTALSKPISEVLRDIPEDKRRQVYAEALAKAKADEEATRASEQDLKEAEAEKQQEEAKESKNQQEDDWAARLVAEAQKKAEAAAVDSIFSKAKDITSGFSWDNFSTQLKSTLQKPEEEPKAQVSKGKNREEPKAQVSKGKNSTPGFSWDSFSAQLKSAIQKPEEEPKVQVATVRGQARARSLPSQKAVVKNQVRQPPPSKPRTAPAPKPKAKTAETKPETRKVFGGLFQQETIYIDDD